MIWMLSIFKNYVDNLVLSRNLDFPAKRVLEHQKYCLKLFCFSSNIDTVPKFSSLGLLTRRIKNAAKLVLTIFLSQISKKQFWVKSTYSMSFISPAVLSSGRPWNKLCMSPDATAVGGHFSFGKTQTPNFGTEADPLQWWSSNLLCGHYEWLWGNSK